MQDILTKKVHIVTMGENIKNIIYLIKSDTKRLENLISETNNQKATELWTLGVKYNNSLVKELQSQLDEQI